jgi:hypothetical protein
MNANERREGSGSGESDQFAGRDQYEAVPPPPPTPEAIARLEASRNDYAASAAMVKDVLGAADRTLGQGEIEQEQTPAVGPDPSDQSLPPAREASMAPDFTSSKPKKRFRRSK